MTARQWPVIFALALPAWMHRLAVAIIEYETRRIERLMNPKQSGSFAGVGVVIDVVLGVQAAKKAAYAQMAYHQSTVAAQMQEFNAARGQLNVAYGQSAGLAQSQANAYGQGLLNQANPYQRGLQNSLGQLNGLGSLFGGAL